MASNISFAPNATLPLPVNSIFKLPIDFLMDSNNHAVDKKLYNNGNISYNYNFNVINYKTHYIWGATASILLNLYERLK